MNLRRNKFRLKCVQVQTLVTDPRLLRFEQIVWLFHDADDVFRTWCSGVGLRITPRSRPHRFLPKLPAVSAVDHSRRGVACQQGLLAWRSDHHLLRCRRKHRDRNGKILQVCNSFLCLFNTLVLVPYVHSLCHKLNMFWFFKIIYL